ELDERREVVVVVTVGPIAAVLDSKLEAMLAVHPAQGLAEAHQRAVRPPMVSKTGSVAQWDRSETDGLRLDHPGYGCGDRGSGGEIVDVRQEVVGLLGLRSELTLTGAQVDSFVHRRPTTDVMQPIAPTEFV